MLKRLGIGRLGIGGKLTVAFGSLAAVTVVVVALSFFAGASVTDDITVAASVRAPAVMNSAQAEESLLRMQSHVRGYLVLGDRSDIEQYQTHRLAFERKLAALQALAKSWSEEDEKLVTELSRSYESWMQLPPKLFELHDNPLKNRPAVRLARLEVQPRKVEVLDHIDTIIGIQKKRDRSLDGDLLADLAGFETSFDAMVTNLIAYATSGELSFKLAYGPQLATNAALWRALSGKRELLDGEQRERFDLIARRRAEIGEIALQIVSIITSERGNEDLYLYRTEFAPQAQALLTLLETLTTRQRAGLQASLGRARDSLSRARVPAILGGLLAITLAVALVWMAHRIIVRPVRRLTRTAAQIAGGDLSARAAVESGDEIGLLAQMIDTRLRKQDLQQLMASISDAVWSAEIANDGSFVYRYYSPVIERITGVPPQHFIESPQRRLEMVHADDRSILAEALQRISSSATDREDAEYRIVRPDGEVRWVRDSVRASRLEDGRIVLNGVVSDVTERHYAEQDVRRLEGQLRQAQRLEAMGTLAGGIAHDFNNILGAILGYGEMALRDAPRASRLRRDLDSIMAAGERGRALVDRILAFSRSGVGERVPVHIERVVSEALELIEAKLPEGVTIETELRAGRAAMLGDPTQVHQVLMNLATNAIQAMAESGTLRVTLERLELETPRLTTTGTLGPGEYVVLKVADTGSGIGKEIIERIFDPFFTTKEVGVGTGLGLSLVHGIVSEVGGAVDVETKVGVGSVFTVYLPQEGEAAETLQDEDATLPDPTLPQGSGQQVLIVDDEEPLVRLAHDRLVDLGYTPEAFTSSAAALEAFRASPQRYEAVVSDERMPGMAGCAMIAEIRAINPTIPILLVSGYVGADLIARAREAGADDVLKKPLSTRDLALALARVLQSPATDNASATFSADR